MMENETPRDRDMVKVNAFILTVQYTLVCGAKIGKKVRDIILEEMKRFIIKEVGKMI